MKQQECLVTTLVLDRLQNLAVFVLRRIHARLFGEVKAANYADGVCHLAMHARHFGIACGGHQHAVKRFVLLRNLFGVQATVSGVDEPDISQCIYLQLIDFRRAVAQAMNSSGFQHLARIVE